MSNLTRILRRTRLRNLTGVTRRFIHKRKVVNPEVVDEGYQVEYQPGEEAQFGYNQYYQYPEGWEPWRNPLNTDFSVFGAVAFMWLMYLMYERTYLESTGRIIRDENKTYYKN